MDRVELLEWSTDQVYIWAANTYSVYLKVREMHAARVSDDVIVAALCEIIESGADESDVLSVREGVSSAVFGDSDNVTFDDIDWTEIIDGITDRRAGR